LQFTAESGGPLDRSAVTSSLRRVLVVLQYPDYLRLFGDAVEALRARGVDVVLAFDKPGKSEQAVTRAAAGGPIEWTTWAPGEWQVLLEELGCVLDYMRFMTPEFAGKRYLRRRMEKYLPERFSRLRSIDRLPKLAVTLAHGAVRLLESVTPEDAGHAELLRRVEPDAVIVSPVILRGRGSARQTQMVKTARRLGIPVAIAVGSWDHLSSKGLLRVRPDRLLVWNGAQRDEAACAQGVDAQDAVKCLALLVEELHVAVRAEDPAHRHLTKAVSAGGVELTRRELLVVVGIDDLVGPPEREAVGGDEDRDAVGTQDPRRLGERAFGVGHVLDRLNRDDRVEARVLEGQ